MSKGPFQSSVDPVNWLQTTRSHHRERPFSDVVLLQYLLGEADIEFSERRFEEVYDLRPLETKRIQGKAFDRALGFPERTGITEGLVKLDDISSRIVTPSGKIVCQKLDEVIVDALSYLFARITLGRMPKWKKENMVLDDISEVLISLNSLFELSSQNDWLKTLWDDVLWQENLTLWERSTIQPDGAMLHRYENQLARLRSNINIIRNDKVRELYKNPPDGSSRIKHYRVNVVKELDLPSLLDFQLSCIYSESFLPVLRNLGLKYRVILNPNRKVVWSQGVCEKLELERIGEDIQHNIQSVTTHIEPVDSNGPPDNSPLLEGGSSCTQISVTDEILSLSIDCYNQETKGWDLWKSRDEKKFSKRGLVYYDTRMNLDSEKLPSQRNIDVLSLMWAHEGGGADNNEFFNKMGVSRSTYNSSIRYLLKENLVIVSYMPNPNYIGLPDGVMIAVPRVTRPQHEKLRKWLLSNTPFVRILSGGKKSGLIAIVRLPLFVTSTWIGYIIQQTKSGSLKGLKGMYIQPITRYTPFRMTALNRVYNPKERSWIDPWSREYP